ncbi:hypothetical protein GF359_08920 [candidate division WOR-3 bacterium]|uniref:Uncharacterized protein n=1 Tax=candidate division WOR-3 bacterium TaxID=2052148 RepID=A0A9D5QDR5_UNCW3|nr:hypothetical protein [candidate division WOR-3 bacterium]
MPYDFFLSNQASPPIAFDRQTGVIYGYGRINWNFMLESEDYFLRLNFNSRIGGDYRYKNDDYTGYIDSTYTRVNTSFGGYVLTSSVAGYYIGRTPFFIGLIDKIKVSSGYTGYRDNYEDLDGFSNGIQGQVFIGPGIGRMRIISPVILAWQFLEENDSESYDNIENLAEFLAGEWTYKLKHWRYEKYFYQDFEKILAENDIMQGLSCEDLMRLLEFKSNMDEERIYGCRLWFGTGGAGAIYSDNFEGSYTAKGFVLRLPVSLEAGYPFSRRWQTYLDVTGYLLSPDFVDWESHLRGEGGIAYYIADRWRVSLAVKGRWWDKSQTTEKWERPPDPEGIHIDYIILPAKGWWVDFPLNLKYYLEDKLYIYGEVSAGRTHHEYPNYDDGITDYTGFDLEIGLTWRLR